jgi:hypothetical protein
MASRAADMQALAMGKVHFVKERPYCGATEHGCSVCAARRYSPRESDRPEKGNEVVNTERTEPQGSLVAMSATPAAARG